MEIRLLKPDEYGLLDRIPDRVKFNPENTWIVVAVKDGKPVGRLVALSLPHIEAAWIDPEIRSGIAGARMEALLTSKLKELGAQAALAFAIDDQMESYLSRLGYRKVATVWRKEL